MVYVLMLWFIVQLFSFATLPFSLTLFSRLPDKGYAFSKALGLVVVGFIVWLLASLHLFPFVWGTIVFSVFFLSVLAWGWFARSQKNLFPETINWKSWLTYAALIEILFVVVLLAFAALRAMNPSIYATEKPMDFAFMNAIGRSSFFPPNDPWFAGGSINYYYFGHYLVALIAVVSGIPMKVMYNLGLALVFALAFVNIFGIGFNIITLFSKKEINQSTEDKFSPLAFLKEYKAPIIVGIAASIFVLVCGNFDTVIQLLKNFKETLAAGWWQGIGWNASRVVGRGFLKDGYITINEFPYFSFILGDMHAHVIGLIPVTLTIAVALSWITKSATKLKVSGNDFSTKLSAFFTRNFSFSVKENAELSATYLLEGVIVLILSGIILGSLGPTNLWDLPVFGFLIALSILFASWKSFEDKMESMISWLVSIAPIALASLVLYLPFYASFEPIKPIGDTKFIIQFIFNVADIGRRTLLSEMVTVWGFFYVLLGIALIAMLVKVSKKDQEEKGIKLSSTLILDLVATDFFFLLLTPALFGAVYWSFVVVKLTFMLVLIILVLIKSATSREKGFTLAMALTGIALVLASEMIYINDFFTPPSERMNTVFKFYYQGWILLGIGAAVFAWYIWEKVKTSQTGKYVFAVVFGLLFLGSLSYPIVATQARFRDFPAPIRGLDGIKFMQLSESDAQRADWDAAEWINKKITGAPYIVESIKDSEGRSSYSEAARISALTGLPAVLGWYSSHENLWRNSAPEIGQRASTIDQIYQSQDKDQIKQILQQLEVRYVIVGDLERKAYPQGDFAKFDAIGELVYENEKVKIYQIAKPKEEEKASVIKTTE